MMKMAVVVKRLKWKKSEFFFLVEFSRNFFRTFLIQFLPHRVLHEMNGSELLLDRTVTFAPSVGERTVVVDYRSSVDGHLDLVSDHPSLYQASEVTTNPYTTIDTIKNGMIENSTLLTTGSVASSDGTFFQFTLFSLSLSLRFLFFLFFSIFSSLLFCSLTISFSLSLDEN